ncbi:MAG TPA: hypothetical protein VGC55_00940, partial [Dokdonella sp.]
MAVIVPLPSAAAPRASSRLHTAGRRLLRRPASVAAGVVIVLFVATAIFAPWLVPLDPLHSDFLMVRQA